MSEQVFDCLIIGGGVAGCTAAIYAKRYSLEVCILDSLGGGGGNTALASVVENYPGFPGGISGQELAERVISQARETGVEILRVTADHIEREGEWWRVTGGDWSGLAHTVIIATGAYPRSMMVPGEKEHRGRGVSYCATCDGFFYRGKTVAVVGGGNSAVDEACYLANLASKVYLIHRRDALRAEQFMQDRAFATPNLEILWDTVVTEVLGETEMTGLRVKNMKTEALTDLTVDGVFVAIGHIAKTEWLGDLVAMEEGFIVTNDRMETSQPGLLACGDIRVTPLRQISTAVGDATWAAYTAYQYVLRKR